MYAEVAFDRMQLAISLRMGRALRAGLRSRLNRAINLAKSIRDFEEWQQSDESDGFPAIHVAYLLSMIWQSPANPRRLKSSRGASRISA